MSRSKQKNKHSKKSEKKKSILGWLIGQIFFTIFILLIIIGSIFCGLTYKNGWGIRGALMTAFFVNQEDIDNLETLNVVLLGISEDLDSKLTDTIMLCSYNPKTADVSMISIPRDTFAGENLEAAKGNDKINVLFSRNHDKFLKEISKIVGIKVDYYAVVNNEALVKIVDIIGGVDFDVPIDMDYDDPTQDLYIHLKKGMQHLDGKQAEHLLRFRHNNDGTSYPGNYGDNDFGRMKTQRAFMEAIAKQTISVKNVFKVRRIYNAVIENIDTNYDIKEAKNYIPTLSEFSFDKIVSNQLPGKAERHNEIWVFVHDSIATKKLIKELGID